MASGFTSTFLLITAFFLCLCGSADAIHTNEDTIDQYISDTKAQGKFDSGIDDVISSAEQLVNMYTVSLSSLIHENRLTLILIQYLLVDARVKRLINLISKKHAEQAVKLKNTNLKSMLQGILDGIWVRTD
ncbi:unnamed protein product [Trichobilharzia regenti]|nr:unnamed protein product [Trichobilharzia regenti]